MIDHDEVKTIIGELGLNYQIELNVFWDAKPGNNLRIMVQSTTPVGAPFCRLPNP
jgi:hypothetical protein